MFSFPHQTKQALYERRIIAPSDIPKSVRQMLRYHSSIAEWTTEERHTTQEERWHDLPTGKTGQLPIEVIASKAFVASIAREGDSDMPPHELTHGMHSEKRGVSKRLTRMLEEMREMCPGTGDVLHIERQMFT